MTKFLAKRKRQLAVFMGAVIIFVTFAVKEEKRDEKKAVGQAIRGAQVIFKGREDIKRVLMDMENLQRHVDAAWNDINREHPKQASEFDYASTMLTTEIENILTESYMALTNANTLFEELPKQSALVKDEYDALVRRHTNLNNEIKRYKERGLQRFKERMRTNPKAGFTSTSTPEEINELKRMVEVGNTLADDAEKFEEKILAEATTERRSIEAEYETYKRWSFWIFVVGWGFNLIAALWLGEKKGA
jgi:replicative superfamily II helicase